MSDPYFADLAVVNSAKNKEILNQQYLFDLKGTQENKNDRLMNSAQSFSDEIPFNNRS